MGVVHVDQQDVEAFIESVPDVERGEAFGYTLFFVGSDRILPFVTLIDSDRKHDNVSNLDREGVYRVNIGVSRETYRDLLGESEGPVDHSVLNQFLPHPHYARQHYVCILSPVGDRAAKTKELIVEAHSLARDRQRRRSARRDNG